MSITIDSQLGEHLSKILGSIQSKAYKEEHPEKVSSNIKRTLPSNTPQNTLQYREQKNYEFQKKCDGADFRIRDFQVENAKLEWAGMGFNCEEAAKIQVQIRELACKEKVNEIRFWGVINGTINNYWIAQGLREPPKSHEEYHPSCQKTGQGVNYFSFWVCNNPFNPCWCLLPDITPEHINLARKIKFSFTGNLETMLYSEPKFCGKQAHYLKAQICRMTHSLQLIPKGVYKVNDDNPKIVEFEEEVKIPETQEMNSLQCWSHRNQNILELGRCSHYVDKNLPPEQFEQKMSELAEKDIEIERLRGITQDKVPESLNLGIENPWIIKFEGNPQVFAKQDANLVYAVVVIKNIFWPGWVSIGYKNGFSNFYIGNGHKLIQPSWNCFTNQDLQEDSPECEEFPEPYPLQEPKPEQPEKGEQNGDEEGQ